jgi:hypothetical protein
MGDHGYHEPEPAQTALNACAIGCSIAPSTNGIASCTTTITTTPAIAARKRSFITTAPTSGALGSSWRSTRLRWPDGMPSTPTQQRGSPASAAMATSSVVKPSMMHWRRIEARVSVRTSIPLPLEDDLRVGDPEFDPGAAGAVEEIPEWPQPQPQSQAQPPPLTTACAAAPSATGRRHLGYSGC